ncbi:MAG: F0F1 ATP synthase subunit delta [Gammaproteobacteria bacterium]|nr:F0F1 ATP synthase subunit delta [Gammaproteobacteria bacterium]
MSEKNTLARPYAKAAFSYAVKNNCLDQWSELLTDLGHVALDKKIVKIIKNPKFTPAKLAEFFESFVEKHSNKNFNNFIKTLASYRRLELLPEIAKLFEELKLKFNKIAKVFVSSAVELNDTQRKAIQTALEKKMNMAVEINFNEKPELIGGIVIQIGDLVIDASIKHMLNRLRTELAA